MDRNRLGVRSLGVERLEERQLMAGDVTAQLNQNLLVITGDAAANGVTVTYDSTTHSFRVTGRDAGGAPTTINGLDTSQPGNNVDFTGVQKVSVKMNGGDDDFQVGSPAAVDTIIQNGLLIEMGDGNDHVVLGSAGNAAGGAAPVATAVRTGGSINIDLGLGNDVLSLANLDIAKDMSILAGGGADQVTFDTEFTPPSTGTLKLFPVIVRQNAGISLGAGLDHLDMKNAAVYGHLVLLDGADAADIKLYNLNVSKQLQINTGDDADEINIEWVRAKGLNINTNGGVDHVVLNRDAFSTMDIKLGARRDHLRIRNTKTTLYCHVDGGAQNATYASAGNSLHGLFRRNFG